MCERRIRVDHYIRQHGRSIGIRIRNGEDLSVDNERSLMVMFGDSSMLAEDDTGANEMRSCPLVGPGCPDSAPTITTSSC